MRLLHDVLHTGAGPKLVRPNMLPLGWGHALDTQLLLLTLGNANGRPFKLLGTNGLRVCLGNIQFRVPFFVTPTLAAPHIIGTSFLHANMKDIRCIEEVVETERSTIQILGPNKSTISAE